MKQEICTREAAEDWRKLIGKFEHEYIKIVNGTAKYDFVCDQTGQPIHKGDPCCAVSVWREPMQTYYAWESSFIDKE